jgi:hypothetical protein
LLPKQATPSRSVRHRTMGRTRSFVTLYDIISRSFSHWVGRTDAGEGLTRLDSGSLVAGFFLLYKKRSIKEHQQ